MLSLRIIPKLFVRVLSVAVASATATPREGLLQFWKSNIARPIRFLRFEEFRMLEGQLSF